MALISLSDWLDRHGDAPSSLPSDSELDSLRLTATDSVLPAEAKQPAPGAGWRARVYQAWRRAFWRLRRQASGHA